MHCLHVHEVSVPIPCVVNANISKPFLVTAYTVSVISDVTMQSVNVTSVPICRSVSKNQCKTFKIPLNVIRSNVHKTVVSYKTVQLFCSGVVAQNVNVISLPTIKDLCFKKHHHVSPIKCFMLETCPFAVIPSTKLPSSSTLSLPPSSLSSSSSISTSLSSSSSSSSSSSPLLLNPSSSSSSSVSF